MRIRQIKPEFWRDKPLAKQPAEVRLFYIGLWMEADDSGWLRWDIAEIGHDLYGYRGEKLRERQISGYTAAILALPGEARLVILDCGHAYLSRLTIHQRFSGQTKQTHTFKKEHELRCPQEPAGTRTSPQNPARIVSVREGSGGDGGTDEEAREIAVANLRAMLDDPSTSEEQKRAARRGLEQWGFAA